MDSSPGGSLGVLLRMRGGDILPRWALPALRRGIHLQWIEPNRAASRTGGRVGRVARLKHNILLTAPITRS